MVTGLDILAALLVGAGLAVTVVGLMVRRQRQGETLAELLELSAGERDIVVEAVTESPAAPPVSKVTARLGDLLGQLDTRGSLARLLARADLPLRPGEFLFLAGATAALGGAVVGYVASSVIVGLIVVVVLGVASRSYLLHKAKKRKKALRTQLPDAFSLIASAVSSGHTFLRSIQLLREQIAQPLAGELDRVVAEVMLGSNLIDALERFAARAEIDELRWAVQAVRIQQTTGGQLGELLHTLADFMRSREEVHREVTVLTAEGRFSGYVLMALPIFVTLALQVTAPHYLHPFFQGWGFFWLGLCVALLVAGYAIIRRLVEIEV